MSNEDLTAIHNKLNKLSEDVVEIKTTLKLMPKPEPRPCPFFEAHIADHKDSKKSWRDGAVGLVFEIAKTAVFIVIGILMGKKIL